MFKKSKQKEQEIVKEDNYEIKKDSNLSQEQKDIKKFYKRSGFDGAKSRNSNALWGTNNIIEDNEIFNNLAALRARSRDLAKNDPTMKRYLFLLDSNIVGNEGFKLQINTKKVNRLNLNKITAIIDAWKDWSDAKNCDITQKSNLKDICSIIVKTLAKDGEAIIKLIRDKVSPDNPYGYKLQVLDTERLDLRLNADIRDGSGNYIKMGVEFNKYSVPVAYHLRKDINKSVYISTYSSDDYERVLKKDLIHLFVQDSPEQTRGYPWAHAVMVSMKNLKEFRNACLLAAKIGAASSIYLERNSTVKTQNIADYKEEDVYYSDMGVGEIRVLPQGVTMKSFQGHFPSETYSDHIQKEMQAIAGGLGLSSVYLANNTKDLNFSSARTVVAEEQNKYKADQNFIINKFLNVIFEDWLLQSTLNNKISFNKTKVSKNFLNVEDLEDISHKFIGRKWQAIDPAKEAEANEMDYSSGMKPRSVQAAERGLDYSEVLEKYKQDAELEKSILGQSASEFLTSSNQSVINNKEDDQNDNKDNEDE